MADNNRTQRIYCHETPDPPIPRQRNRACDHNPGTCEAEKEGPFEAFQQPGKFFEKGGVFDFFYGGSPAHADLEEVAEERLGYVNGDAAQEDGEEKEPFEVLEDWRVSVRV